MHIFTTKANIGTNFPFSNVTFILCAWMEVNIRRSHVNR